MTSVLAPVKNIALQGIAPDVIQSCVLAPAVPAPTPEPEDVIYAPVAPGITYGSLPVITTGTTPGNLVIVDTSPDQIIGCCNDVGTDPQSRLNALFPSAVDGDGVVDRATNNIWVYDGATWNNVGPTPGPTLTVNTTIPPWNEIVVYDARVRTRLEVNGLAYALELLTEPAAYGITLGLTVQTSQALVRVPAADQSFAVQLPAVSSGVSVLPPAAATTLAAPVPQVSSGGSVAVPLADIPFAASMVPYVGTGATVVQPPNFNAVLLPLSPTVVSGASVAVPIGSIVLLPSAPDINVRWGPDILTFSITPDSTDPNPANNYYRRTVFTSTYSSTEMSTACGGLASATVYGMRLQVLNAPQNQPFPNYTVGAKNTSNAVDANNSGTNGGTFIEVRSAQDQLFIEGAYVDLIFDTPIQWTGGNFVFSWAWCAAADWSESGVVPAGTGISFHEQTDDDGCYTIDTSVSGAVSFRPVMQLLYKA